MLVTYQKSNEWAQRTSEIFWYKNKDRKRFPCSVAFAMYILFSDALNLCLELYFAFLLFLDYEADNEAKAMFGDSEEDGKGNWQSFLLCQLIVVE